VDNFSAITLTLNLAGVQTSAGDGVFAAIAILSGSAKRGASRTKAERSEASREATPFS